LLGFLGSGILSKRLSNTGNRWRMIKTSPVTASLRAEVSSCLFSK